MGVGVARAPSGIEKIRVRPTRKANNVGAGHEHSKDSMLRSFVIKRLIGGRLRWPQSSETPNHRFSTSRRGFVAALSAAAVLRVAWIFVQRPTRRPRRLVPHEVASWSRIGAHAFVTGAAAWPRGAQIKTVPSDFSVAELSRDGVCAATSQGPHVGIETLKVPCDNKSPSAPDRKSLDLHGHFIRAFEAADPWSPIETAIGISKTDSLRSALAQAKAMAPLPAASDVWAYNPDDNIDITARVALCGHIARAAASLGCAVSAESDGRLVVRSQRLHAELCTAGISREDALRAHSFMITGPHDPSQIMSVLAPPRMSSERGIVVAARIQDSAKHLKCRYCPDPEPRFEISFKPRRKRSPKIYARFVLEKRNYESVRAMRSLAKALGVEPTDVTIAGTKDKRGVTHQWVTVRGVTPSRVAKVKLPIGLAICGPVDAIKGPQTLGAHGGNRFEVVIRWPGHLPPPTRDAIERSVAAVRECGFVNYFGTQRFGQPTLGDRPSICVIGRALLRSDAREAVRAILNPASDRRTRVARALSQLRIDGNLHSAHRAIPRSAVVLRSLFRELKRQTRRNGEAWPNTSHKTCLRTLRAVPRGQRQRWIHAYQSFLWNCSVSRRLLQDGGVRPPRLRVGDLVAMPSVREVKQGKPPPSSTVSSENVILVTESNIDRLDIADLVVPILGAATAQRFEPVSMEPGSVCADSAQQLQSEGLDVENFDKSRNSAGISLRGGYRRVFAIPQDLSMSWPGDDGTEEDLGEKLKLSFDLGVSAYATSMLREMAKYGVGLPVLKKPRVAE